MLKQACIALAISALVLGFGGRPGQAGWGDAGSSLKLGASSPLISVKKNKKHDDGDDDHHHKNKNTDDDAALSECTIEQPGGGGGCKGGFKRVCEKMKSGKKCCGCVVDKNAVPATNPDYACCEGFGADGNKVGEKLCGDININKDLLKNTYHATTITCTGH